MSSIFNLLTSQKIDAQNYSIMPEGLIRVFKDQELRDLISYLGGDGQVPLP